LWTLSYCRNPSLHPEWHIDYGSLNVTNFRIILYQDTNRKQVKGATTKILTLTQILTLTRHLYVTIIIFKIICD